MLPTLFWKEYREHRTVWLAMALLGAVVLAVLNQTLGDSAGSQLNRYVACVTAPLAVVASLLSGRRSRRRGA